MASHECALPPARWRWRVLLLRLPVWLLLAVAAKASLIAALDFSRPMLADQDHRDRGWGDDGMCGRVGGWGGGVGGLKGGWWGRWQLGGRGSAGCSLELE